MAISAAAIHKGFGYMAKPPFNLTMGDTKTRLLEFSRQDTEPSEETARKVWLLLRTGFQAGGDRLREMKHSSMTAEQDHAAGSVFMK